MMFTGGQRQEKREAPHQNFTHQWVDFHRHFTWKFGMLGGQS
jgi:hypothetical protein